MRVRAIVLVTTIVCAGCLPAMAGSPAALRKVPAQLVRVRDGLGNAFAKLREGGEVKIAYLGGSITAQNGWRPKTLKWFRESFPKADVVEVNAAIGGTGSDLGVFRLQQDVLQHNPDLLFVEFAVNDGGAPPRDIWRAMEGIVRKTWRQNPSIDICYVYTFAVGFERDLNEGVCPRAASADEILADHYGIPSINVALRVTELAREGKLQFKPKTDPETKKELEAPSGVILFSKDGVHPLDAGHDVYTGVITSALAEMANAAAPRAHELKSPFVEDNWERAKLLPLERTMLTPGWRRLDPEKGLGKRFHNRMKSIWEADRPGEKISFRFKGTAVRLYDLMGPDAGQVVCTIDGKTGQPRARFDSYCTYHRLAHFVVARELEDAVHTVTVEIHPDQPDRSAVVDREKGKPGFDPKKYDGHAIRVGGILLIGEIVND